MNHMLRIYTALLKKGGLRVIGSVAALCLAALLPMVGLGRDT
jgi:hypothetical protein